MTSARRSDPVMTHADHEDHERFLVHLTASDDAVWAVAVWLRGRGYLVSVPPYTRSRTHAEWQDHADAGDLYIQQRVEVKQLGCTFRGREDWPFGDKFIVCARHAWDRAVPRPYAFVILSADRQCAAIVHGRTSPAWFTESRRDRRYVNMRQDFYFCPLNLVIFQRVQIGA